MHVKVRERDGQLGTQVESTDAHVVLINTTQRTMEITEQEDGRLLVRASEPARPPRPGPQRTAGIQS